MAGAFFVGWGAAFLTMGFDADFVAGLLTGFGVGLRNYLQDPQKVRVFNYSMAALLLASLVPVLFGLE